MVGKKLFALLRAIVLAGLCAAVQANATSAGVGIEPDYPQKTLQEAPLQLAQNDIALPPIDMLRGPVVEEVPAMPSTAAMRAIRIALLLPLRSPSLGAAAEAVRAGFVAAHERQPAGIVVNIVGTDGSAQQALSAYADAAANSDIVVGPLARSEVTAVAQSGMVRTPTIALGQPEAGVGQNMALPPKMMVVGLSAEDEARQLARLISTDQALRDALVISTNVSWQRRAADAFTAEWRSLGLTSNTVELKVVDGYLTPDSLLALRERVQQAPPQLMFLALDATLTAQLRLAIGTDIPMYGTSQLNPLTLADWQIAQGFPDMDGMRFLDIPWQLETDHPAVMSYPPMSLGADQRRSADLERLYALGIDAYRIALELAGNRTHFELDGVTGKLRVQFSESGARFERMAQPALYFEGRVIPLNGAW